MSASDFVPSLGRRALDQLRALGHNAYFFADLVKNSPTALRRFYLVVAQIHAIGNLSLLIIAASGLAVGFVLALQMYYALSKYGAAESLGLVVNLSLVRELGPVVTALLFAGRAGTSLTAEIGLMKAGEQLAAIESLGGKARGFSGAEIFKCRKLITDGIDYGYVGEVIEVNTDPLRQCIHRSITPVISPIALGEDGHIYNCNADVAAAKAAIALKARRLVFMSDVPGLMRNPKDPATLISSLHVAEVPALKAAGIVDKGMIPKVDSAVEAVKSGVHRVHFVDGRVPHSLLLEIFTDKGVGTEIVQ